jgi:hypothetical protein
MHGEADQRHRADALPDRASMDVAVDQPRLLQGVTIAAAGEGGHMMPPM